MTDLLPKGYLVAFKDDGGKDFKYTVKTKEIYIGGGTDCDIRLRNEDIIGRCCVIKLESSNRIIIRSLIKGHSVLVNNKVLNDEEYVLKPGDVIRIFTYNFRWENIDKSKEDKISCPHTSLMVDEIERIEEQRRYSAPSRLEFESARDNDTFNIENGTTSFTIDHEKKNLNDPNASKILTKIDEGSHILEDLDILHEPPSDVTLKKDEYTFAEQHFGEKTPRNFGETYHSTPKFTTNINQQKKPSSNPPSSSSNELTENLLAVIESPAKLRVRRSTGMVPLVGTPSHVYRVTRNILTPASGTQPSPENVSCAKSNVLASNNRLLSERKSTPLKSQNLEKSIIHSPIIEDYTMEKTEENQNENESKYKFVASRRRKHFRASSFAIENRIVEESESSRDELNNENEDDVDENVVDSIFDDSQETMSARIIINGDSKSNTYEDLAVDGIYLNDSTEPCKDTSVAPTLPKSILTPLPKTGLLNKEKGAKKVTFARSIIQKTSGSCNSATFKDSSDSLSYMYNISGDTEDASLDSFCRNEELYLPDGSQSETSINTLCSTPVKGKRILTTLNGDVSTGFKTPSLVSSCSIIYCASTSTDDVDLTRAEKTEFIERSNYDDNARFSAISNNLARFSKSMKSSNLEEKCSVLESGLSHNFTGTMNFTNLEGGENNVRQSDVLNNLTPYSNSTNVSPPNESESSIPIVAESNNLILSKSNSVDVGRSICQSNNFNSASESMNEWKLEMSENSVYQPNNLTSASKSINVSNVEFEASASQSGVSNTSTPSKSLNCSIKVKDEDRVSPKNLTLANKSMIVSDIGKKQITYQPVLSNNLTPKKSMNVSNLRKRESSVNHSVIPRILIHANKSLNVSNLEEDESSILQSAVLSNNVSVISKSMETSNIEELNSSVCHAGESSILISSKSMNLSTIEEHGASISEFVASDNMGSSKSVNLTIEKEEGTPVSEPAFSDHKCPSKLMNLFIREKCDTPICEHAVSDDTSSRKSINLSIIEEVESTISEPPVTNNLTVSNESMSSIRILPKKLSIASNISLTEINETVVDTQDIPLPRSPTALPSDSKTDDASENIELVSEENRGSADVPEIIVTEFVDSNENTVSVEHFTIPVEQDQEGPAESAIEKLTTPVANYENVSSMKRMINTPCESRISYDNVEGVQHLMKTPRRSASIYENFEGIQELVKTSAISVPTTPHHFLLAEKPLHSGSVVAESKIMNISQAGLPPPEFEISSKFITSFQTGVSNTCKTKPSSSIIGTSRCASNDSEITPSMKSCTDLDSIHATTLLPCTSTPHHIIKNFLQQSSSLPTEGQHVSEISRMCPSSSENEVNSQATCNPPDIAMLESGRFVSQESSSFEKTIGGSWDRYESNANEILKESTQNVNSKRFDVGSQPASEILLVHSPATYKNERLKEDVRPAIDEIVGTQESETVLGSIKHIFMKPAETTLHLENAVGMREMFKTPRESTVSYENVVGMKQMFQTPTEAKSSYENVAGVKQMFKTPVELKSSYENVCGMKQMFKTPLQSKTSYLDVSGVEELLRTPAKGGIENSIMFEECAQKSTCVPEMVESFISVVPSVINKISDRIEALPQTLTCSQNEGVTGAVSIVIEGGTLSTMKSTVSTNTASEKHEVISESRKLLSLSHHDVVLPRTDSPRDREGLSGVSEVRSSIRNAAQLGVDVADEKSATKRAWNDLNNQIFNKIDERTPNRKSKRMLLKNEIETTSAFNPTTTLKKLNVSDVNKINEEVEAMTQLNEQYTLERKSSIHLENIDNVSTISPMNKRPFRECNDDPVLASSPTTVTRKSPFSVMLTEAVRENLEQVLPLEEGIVERNEDPEPRSRKIRVSRKKAASKKHLSSGKEISKLNSVVTPNLRRNSSLQKSSQKMSVKVVVLSPVTVSSKRTSKKIQPGVKELSFRKRNVNFSTSSVSKAKTRRNVRGKLVQQKQVEERTESPNEEPKRAVRSNRQIKETVSQPESSQPKRGKAMVKETVPQLETNRPKRGKVKSEEIAPQLENSNLKRGTAKIKKTVRQLENSRPKRGRAKIEETMPQFQISRPKRGKAKAEETVQTVETSRPKRGKARVEETVQTVETSRPKRGKAKVEETVQTVENSCPKRGKAKVEKIVQTVETSRQTRSKAKLQESVPDSAITKAEIRKRVETENGSKKTRVVSPPKKEVTKSRKLVQGESPATNKRPTRKRKVVETPEPSSSKTSWGKRNEIASEATFENKSKAKPKKNETAKIEEAIDDENGKSASTQNTKRSRKLVTCKTKKRKFIVREIVEVEPKTKRMKKEKFAENVETIDEKSDGAKERSVETVKKRSRIRVSVVMKVEAPTRIGWLSKNTKSAISKASSSSQKKIRVGVGSPVMRVTRSSTTRGNPVKLKTSSRQ